MSFRNEVDSKRHKQSAWQKWIPIIGLIVILGFFGSVIWSSGSYSNAALINEYFQPVDMQKINADYPVVIDNNTITNIKYLEQQYVIAESFFKKGDFPKALEAYNFVLKNKQNTAYDLEKIDFDAARWNQSLMLLGNGEREKAIDELKKISTSDLSEKYKNDASALKEKLNSFWYGWAN